MKKNIRIHLLYQLSYGTFLLSLVCMVCFPSFLVNESGTLVIRYSAYAGFAALCLLLVSKNLATLKGKGALVTWFQRFLPVQRELGLLGFNLFALHIGVALFVVFQRQEDWLFQILSGAIPLSIFVFLWITSLKDVQQQYRKWKLHQSVVWISIPLIVLHEGLITGGISLWTFVCCAFFVVGILISLFHSKNKKRIVRQLRFVSIGSIVLIVQLLVTQFVQALQTTNMEAQTNASSETSSSDSSTTSSSTSNSTPTNEATVVLSTKYKDGTYTGSAQGYGGTMQVEVVITSDIIESVEIVSNQETPRFLSRAKSTVISEILSNQSVDVAGVSGATYSSNGIKDAVEDALSQATNG